MLPMLSSAMQPVKPVLNRDADNFANFSAPPGHRRYSDDSDNYDEYKYDDDTYDDDNYDDDWSPR